MGMNAAQSSGFPPPGVVGAADNSSVTPTTAPSVGNGLVAGKVAPPPTTAHIPRPIQPIQSTRPVGSGGSPYLNRGLMNNYGPNQRYKFNLDGDLPDFAPGKGSAFGYGYANPKFSDLVGKFGQQSRRFAY